MAGLLALSAQARAISARVSGAEMNGFGRAVFTFAEMPKTTTKVLNGVLIVTFDQAVTVNLDKLVMEMSSYVSAARMDPDNKGFRLGFVRPLRVSTMDAGEQLYLDLLPEAWKGPPPALPASVVEDLSRRLREAEETARKLTRKAAAEIRPEIVFRVGTTSALSRIVFETPEIVPVSLQTGDNSAELIFDSALRLDGPALKAALPEWVTSVQVTPSAETLKLSLGLAPGVQVNGFREDEAYAIDIVPARSDAGPAKAVRALDAAGLNRHSRRMPPPFPSMQRDNPGVPVPEHPGDGLLRVEAWKAICVMQAKSAPSSRHTRSMPESRGPSAIRPTATGAAATALRTPFPPTQEREEPRKKQMAKPGTRSKVVSREEWR